MSLVLADATVIDGIDPVPGSYDEPDRVVRVVAKDTRKVAA